MRFRISALFFQAGLLFVTFEQIRPLGVMLSDYCFFLSFVLIPKSLLGKVKNSGIFIPLLLIMGGTLLSLRASNLSSAAESLLRLVILFALIAPLSIAHAEGIRRNLLFLFTGISLNCFIALLQASLFPGIVDLLSINPPSPDLASSGRFQGLTEHPVTLGLASGLGTLLGIGLFSFEKSRFRRWIFAILIFVCCVAALLSGSRTFFAALIPALLVFALAQKHRRKSLIRAAIGLALLVGSLNYFAAKTVSQYSERIGDVGLVDYTRLASAGQIILEIREKPLLGWGVDRFEEGGVIKIPLTGEVAPAHNTFLRYWYAAGLLGAAGFLALFLIPMKRMFLAIRSEPPNELRSVLGLVLAASVFLFIVSNLGPYIYNRYLYVPLFVFAGFAASVPAPARKPAKARTESRFKSLTLGAVAAFSLVLGLVAETISCVLPSNQTKNK